MQTTPSQVAGLTFLPASSDNTRLSVEWSLLVTDAETGGSPILSYVVEASMATLPYNWSTVATTDSSTNQATATGVTPGASYVMRVYATNLHGSGVISDELTVLAA